MNERKNLVKIFFSLLDTKKKSAKDRSLSSARRARPAQKKNKEGFVLSSTSRHICESLSDLLLSSSPEHKRREIQKRKREREKKTRKIKPAYAILHVQLHLLLRTRLALHLHLTHVARRPRRRREHFTLHLPLSISLSFLLFVCFYLEFPIVYFFPWCSVNTKIPTN